MMRIGSVSATPLAMGIDKVLFTGIFVNGFLHIEFSK